MGNKNYANPEQLLDENFDPDNLHPADIEQVIIAAYDEYEAIPKFTRLKKQYRDKYNYLVDLLTEKRGFNQFSHL